ncbi:MULTISPECIES: hypothetical protein [Bradyrhizobium]|uniref:hypothetical protein n=1 Tax=Bradyrhizobium TaxID=374 RepID=UPI001BAC0040|nr:hypothetical protein [Bradyrhizobium liaoningense]MBR0983281.1 hypothetical protein [Bradyrhizobium liaoningense]GMP01136.1 hypothetical protein TM239_27510 [Bradyrhizobium sp. TM239]
MSPATILERIRGLFASDTSEHLDRISDAFKTGTLREPARPMSDQELACAIREFRSAEVSDWTIAKLSRRFIEVPRDGRNTSRG